MEEKTEAPKSALDEAKDTLAAITAKAEELKEWTLRAEAVKAEKIISGQAEAGQAPPAPKVETPKEYKDKLMRGEL